MKFNSTKKALALSVLSLVVCVSLLIGTTFAWFTDSVSSTNNIIKSGNLDVELYYQAEGQDTWTKVDQNTNVFKDNTLWEPGHTEVVKFKVVNEGSLALKYALGVNVVSETASVNVEGNSFKLSDYIKYAVVKDDQAYTREQAIAAAEVNGATELKFAFSSDYIALYPETVTNAVNDDEDVVTMVVYMPETVGNEANYANGAAVPTINLGINLFATQLVYEEDSFGSDYDKDAYLEVTSFADMKDALAEGVTEFNFMGNTIGLNYGLSKAMIPEGTTVTISNAVVSGKNYGNATNGTVIFENCTFTNTGAYSIHFDAGNGDVIFKNCELYGWNSFGDTLNSVRFYNCSLYGNGTYGLIRSYSDLYVENCYIDTTNANHTDNYSEGVEAVSGATLTEKNNTYVAKTLANVMALAKKGNTTIDAKGANLGDYNYDGTFANGTVLKNAKFTYVYGASVDGVATFENCEFVSDHSYSANFSDGSYTGKVIFNNCYFDGWNSFGDAITSVEMNNCTFETIIGPYSILRFYQDAVLNNCVIKPSFEGIDTNKAGTVVKLNNCTGIEGKIYNNTEGGVVKVGKWIVDGVELTDVPAW